MKTIEERAKGYSLKDFDGYYTGRENAVEEGYIAGAREQREIDMKMFEKWYCEEKCYNRQQCYRPTRTCHRLVKIEKGMLEKYEND